MAKDHVELSINGYEKSGEEMLVLQISMAPVLVREARAILDLSDHEHLFDGEYALSLDQLNSLKDLISKYLDPSKWDFQAGFRHVPDHMTVRL